jgi:hypothetical protein
MRKPGGHVIIYAPDEQSQRVVVNGTVIDTEVEADTFSCAHCQFVVVVKPFCDAADAGGLCKCCMGLICPHCVDLGTCTPIERYLEIEEAKAQFLRSMQEWG